jgi:hypothetical protein
MSEMLPPEEVKIDNQSQLVLWQLRDEEWERALTLRRAANLAENRQVFYRMEEYLIPAGLVEEQARENTGDLRRFRLTQAGKDWVEDRGKKLKMPTTHEQIQNYALEGYEAGTSAKESVQTYRKKLHRLKRRVERAEEDVEAIEESEDQNAKQVQYLDERTQAVRGRSKRNNNWLHDLQEEVDDRETIRGVDEVRDDVSDAERRLNSMGTKQEGLTHQQAIIERERAAVRALAKPAGYVAVGAAVAYLVVLGGVLVLAAEFVVSVVIAGIVALLAVAFGSGVAIYLQARGSPGVTSGSDDDERSVPAD